MHNAEPALQSPLRCGNDACIIAAMQGPGFRNAAGAATESNSKEYGFTAEAPYCLHRLKRYGGAMRVPMKRVFSIVQY